MRLSKLKQNSPNQNVSAIKPTKIIVKQQKTKSVFYYISNKKLRLSNVSNKIPSKHQHQCFSSNDPCLSE